MNRLTMPLLAVLALSVCAQAQDQPQPLTQVALFKVKPNKGADWTAVMKGVYAPVLEQLMKDGVVSAYGADMDILHRAGKPNASAWFTVADWASYGKVQTAIEDAQRKNPGQMVRSIEATDPEAHADLLLRSPVFNMKKPPAGALPVSSLSMIRLKAGKEAAYMSFFNTYSKPVLDQLLKDGVIWGYGIDVEMEHTLPTGTRVQWMILPDLAARDKVDAAFRAARAKAGADERRKAQETIREITEGDHTDWLSSAIVFGVK